MVGAAVVYLGLTITTAGLFVLVKPVRWLRIPTRSRAIIVVAIGLLLATTGFSLPAPELRVSGVETRLDEFVPVWQFREFHETRIAAPPARVFEAIERVRADEIFLFRALTWIRRGGRPLPDSILDAGEREALIEVATRSDFVLLAREVPRELVIGTVVLAPPDAAGTLVPRTFRTPLPAGYALAAMNFVVTSDGASASVVSTETRVYANSPSARRRFAAYWRLIYPGSALIRRMWLRAVRRRAIGSAPGLR